MCVCILVLVIWHENCIFPALHYVVICGLSGSAVLFPHYLINGTFFGKKKRHWK